MKSGRRVEVEEVEEEEEEERQAGKEGGKGQQDKRTSYPTSNRKLNAQNQDSDDAVLQGSWTGGPTAEARCGEKLSSH